MLLSRDSDQSLLAPLSLFFSSFFFFRLNGEVEDRVTTNFEAFSLGAELCIFCIIKCVWYFLASRYIFFKYFGTGMMIHKSWKVAKVQISDVSYL